MAFLQMNILYLIYVGHIEFYQTKRQKRIEIFNESMNITMCYSYLLLCNLVTDKEQRANIGYQLLIAASSLIALNLAFMLVLVIQKILTSLKRQFQKRNYKKQVQSKGSSYAIQ